MNSYRRSYCGSQYRAPGCSFFLPSSVVGSVGRNLSICIATSNGLAFFFLVVVVVVFVFSYIIYTYLIPNYKVYVWPHTISRSLGHRVMGIPCLHDCNVHTYTTMTTSVVELIICSRYCSTTRWEYLFVINAYWKFPSQRLRFVCLVWVTRRRMNVFSCKNYNCNMVSYVFKQLLFSSLKL